MECLDVKLLMVHHQTPAIFSSYSFYITTGYLEGMCGVGGGGASRSGRAG